MKKVRWLFVLVLGLVIASSFSSCDSPVKKGDIIIERIESNWLVLEADNISKKSYNDPQNLFLTGRDSSGEKTNYYCCWYKNINGEYKLIAINFIPSNTLSSNLVYKIKDTINVDKKFYLKTNLYNKDGQGFKILAKTYSSHKGELIKRSRSKKYLASCLGLVVKISIKDSLVRYLPEKKSFAFTATKPIIEKRLDLIPDFFIFAILLLTISFTVKKPDGRSSLSNIKKIWEKLFWVLFLANFVYYLLWSEWEIDFSSVVSIIIGSLVITGIFYIFFFLARIPIGERCYKRASKIKKISPDMVELEKENYIVPINKIYWALIVSGITFLNVLLFGFPLNLSVLGALITFSPGIFLLIKSRFKEKQKQG